jgi:hypothetical protein
MLVIRNGHTWPAVLSPGIDLVISQEVRSLLEGLPNLAFCGVAFTVYHIPWTPGQKTPIKPSLLKLFYDDPAQFHDCLPKSTIEPPAAYFEVVHCRYEHVVDRYQDAGSRGYEYRFETLLYRDAVLSIPPGLLDDFPIAGTEYGFLIRRDVFALLERFIDRDFFEVVHINHVAPRATK